MQVLPVAIPVVLTVLALLVITIPPLVGLDRVRRTIREFRPRFRDVAPYLAFVALVLLVNKGAQDLTESISWGVGRYITGEIFNLEGTFVAELQSLTPSYGITYLSAIYVVGYAYLLVFPLLAYACLPRLTQLKALLVAYGCNYGLGVLGYIRYVAYGPRNYMPDLVDQPLYEALPEIMLLTSAINTNTNVFPSLHTSLSVTVMVFAVLTHRPYRAWTPIALVIGSSVVLSTMVLAIHWLTDVIAGIGLGLLAAGVGLFVVRLVEERSALRIDPDDPHPDDASR